MPNRPDNVVDPTAVSPFVPKGGRKNAPKKLAREEALGGVPERLPVESQEDMAGGGVRLRVKFSRPRWQRWFGMSETTERSFELDAFGRKVYESCDGRRDVKSVVKTFGESHKLSPAEAEISVTTFLKMLIGKALIVMHVPGRTDNVVDPTVPDGRPDGVDTQEDKAPGRADKKGLRRGKKP